MVTLGAGQPGAERQVWLTETAGPVPPGDKDLVVCVHGMSGSATDWTELMRELAGDFDCVAVDLPGSGHSAPPASRRDYSITAHARTVTALLEELTAAGHRGGVHLIGNSLGGAVSVRVAALRPDLVRTLTLVSPVLPVRRPRRPTAHFPLIALPLLGGALVRRYARLPTENRVAGVMASCCYDPARLSPGLLALQDADLRERDKLGYDIASIVGAARTLVGESLRPRRFSLWRAAERITVPSLVMFGSHDQLVPAWLAAPAARAFAGARYARVLVLPLTGHIAQMERPGLVAARFREMVAVTDAEGAAEGEGPRGNSGSRAPVDA